MGDIVIFYGHAASNWGDLAINSGLLNLLELAGRSGDEIRAVRLHPADRYDRLSRESLHRAHISDINAATGPQSALDDSLKLNGYLGAPDEFVRKYRLRSADLIIVNSGEHIFESSTGENVRDLLWRILPLIAANRAATPAMVMPSTIGPFRTSLGDQIANLIARLPTAFAYREVASRDLMASTELANHPVFLDPGFFAHGLRIRENFPEIPRSVGLVFRLEDYGLRPGSKRSAFVQAKNRSTDFQESQAYRAFARVAERHLTDGCSVRLIVQTQADRELTLALYEALKRGYPNQDVQLKDPETFQEYLDELSDVDLLITSRFHAVILAEAQGVPAVGVYSENHGHKMAGLFSLLGCPGAVVRLDDRNAQIVADDIDTAAKRSWNDRLDRLSRIQDLMARTKNWFDEALTAQRQGPVDTSRTQIAALAELNRASVEWAQQNQLKNIQGSLTRIDKSLENLVGETDRFQIDNECITND